ncbi:helix-turn-helix domain-containing protein [Salmonella enterica]
MSLPGGRYGIVISKTPLIKAGIGSILGGAFPEYQLIYYSSLNEITLPQLKSASLIISDFSGEQLNARRECQHYYSLFPQCDNTHWIFFIPRSLYPVAVEFLLRPQTTLLSEVEAIDEFVNVVREGHENKEKISKTLLSPDSPEAEKSPCSSETLTFSERKVLRLLGKGWGINQIAMLLKKSNKTISAQKNSAMRRLSLRSNADLYTWINSERGVKELNPGSAYGEQNEWKVIAKKETLPSSKNA